MFKPLENVSSVGRGSSSITLYRPEMRAARNTAVIAGTLLGAQWESCPYEIIRAPQGLAVSRIGIVLPCYYSEDDYRLGLPYQHAEAIRWSYLAESHADAGICTLIETRIREVRIKRSYEAEIGDCVAYECTHWRELHDAAMASPAARLPAQEEKQERAA